MKKLGNFEKNLVQLEITELSPIIELVNLF